MASTKPLNSTRKIVSRGEDPTWISKRFAVDSQTNNFIIDRVPVERIAQEVPPPFFVYAAGDIQDRYQALSAALNSHGIAIYFSMKANSSLAVVTGLRQLGSGLEIASIGELEVAKAVGADPKKVSFAGPVKTQEELEAAIDYGVGTINVESEREFERINEIAGQKGKKQRVGIRVNHDKEVADDGGLMGGGAQKFGIDVDKLTPEFIAKITQLPNIDLAGIHIVAATQMLNVEAFLNNLKNVCNVARKLNDFFPIRYIDFGGGLGIPYAPDQPELPLDMISHVIGKTLSEYSFLRDNKTELYVEPGRYLTGPSGVYISRVDHIKESRNVRYVLVDGGLHHMMRTA